MTDEGATPPERDAGSWLPDNWAELGPMIDTILAAPAEERESLILHASKGDAIRRTQLEQLIRECEQDLPLIERPAAEGFAGLFDGADEVTVPEIVGDRYRIESEAGRGGMARVFLAHDTKHDRKVAVKVIRSDIAVSLGSERFLQEIAIAARLRHPNIIPMYDSGETDGVLYFVMPYEEGPSLRVRLSQNDTLDVGERISILRDVARALAYAHERGVVHRDIKPDNILLSGGAAVVSDFGIAKAVSLAQSEPDTGGPTLSDPIIGTPSYMAPEQAMGDPSTDHRADIYSFGCLAYELFAGAPPFEKLADREAIVSQLSAKPPAIETVSTDVPASLGALITRCLEVKPDDRPQSARELLIVLESGDRDGASRQSQTVVRVAMTSLVILGVVIATSLYRDSRNVSRVVVPAREATVAVLPLLSNGDSAQRELGYGLSDEIASALVEIPGVRVMSRRAASQMQDESIGDPQKKGRELGADYLVIGTLDETDGRLNVLAKLVQAKDGATLWLARYHLGIDGLGDVRDVIARSVGDSLRKRSGWRESTRAVGRATRHIAAEPYRLYVLAQRALNLRGQSMQASAEMFRRATELDSLYAGAYSGLSLALALTPYFQPVAPPEVWADATAAARRAIQLDSSLAQPHVALGIVYSQRSLWDSASSELREGLRLRTAGDIEPLVQYGRFLLFRGQIDAGLRQFLIARATEPASAVVRSWTSYSYYLQGNMDSALVESARALQSDSTNITTLAFGANVLLASGDVAGARNLSLIHI